MTIERFETQREFNRRFPSKLYVCCWCGLMTPNPMICMNCGNQSNVLFNTGGIDETYIYQIGDNPEIQIFRPIELEMKGEKDG